MYTRNQNINMAPELQGHHQPVAIVGMSCRFAGEASSPSALWKLCEKGKTAWSPIPPERFDTRSFYHPDKGKLGRVSSMLPDNYITTASSLQTQ